MGSNWTEDSKTHSVADSAFQCSWTCFCKFPQSVICLLANFFFTSSSKLSLLSILTSRYFSEVLYLIKELPTSNWVSSVFAKINYTYHCFLSFGYRKATEKLSKQNVTVRELGHHKKTITSMTRNKSLRTMLIKIWPSIDPYGTQKRISSQELYKLFILALCLRLVR